MKNQVLSVENLTVELGQEQVIKDLSFEINQGDFLTILGPNGAGKSVLLRTLLGLVPVKKGVFWKKKLRRGYLPQGLSPLKFKHLPLSVGNFFAFKKIEIDRCLETLRQVGFTGKILPKQLGDLSFGQLQRVLAGWILISEPEILFLDEPAGMDIGMGKSFYSLLYKLWKERGMTIVLVTHDLQIVYKYSTNVLCLGKKNGHCFGGAREILTPETLEKAYGTEIKFYKHKT